MDEQERREFQREGSPGIQVSVYSNLGIRRRSSQKCWGSSVGFWENDIRQVLLAGESVYRNISEFSEKVMKDNRGRSGVRWQTVIALMSSWKAARRISADQRVMMLSGSINWQPTGLIQVVFCSEHMLPD